MKKEILIDTSYLLPIFGINVKLDDISREDIKIFWSDDLPNYNFNISDISLLEVLYTLNSDYRKFSDDKILHRYSKILPTILNNPNLTIVHSNIDPMIIDYANIVRLNKHTDYLDCLISATALRLEAVFITEDTTLKKLLRKIKDFENLKIVKLKKLIKLE